MISCRDCVLVRQGYPHPNGTLRPFSVIDRAIITERTATFWTNRHLNPDGRDDIVIHDSDGMKEKDFLLQYIKAPPAEDHLVLMFTKTHNPAEFRVTKGQASIANIYGLGGKFPSSQAVDLGYIRDLVGKLGNTPIKFAVDAAVSSANLLKPAMAVKSEKHLSKLLKEYPVLDGLIDTMPPVWSPTFELLKAMA